MRSLLTLVGILTFTFACGDGLNDRPLDTFGDGTVLISEVFCERTVEHGQRPEEAYAYCVDSQVFQLCRFNFDCAEELSGPESELFARCADGLQTEWDCVTSIPEVCVEVLGL